MLTIQESSPASNAIDLTAMIDVIFILLIFWMTVTRLGQPPSGPPLDTPLDRQQIAQEVPPSVVTITYVNDQSIMVDEEAVSLADLETVLSGQVQANHILLRAAGDTDCIHLTRLAERLRRMGIEKIGFAVQRASP